MLSVLSSTVWNFRGTSTPVGSGAIETKSFDSRGYITLKKPTTDVAVQKKIALEVQEWIKGKVGHPKYLRGGVIVVSEIPRR